MLFAVAIVALLIAEFLRTKARTKDAKIMSQATDRLAHSIGALAVSVDALIARPIPTDESAAVNAAADEVDALKTKVDAAISPTVPAPPPAAE